MIMVVILVRTRPLKTIRLLGAAMAAQPRLFDRDRPYVPKSTLWWTLPIMAGNPVLIWLWVRATFDDDFVSTLAWRLVAARDRHRFLGVFGWTAGRARRAATQSISLVTLMLAISTVVQTVRTWSADLVAGRRRLRLAMVTSSLLFIGLLAISHLTSDPDR